VLFSSRHKCWKLADFGSASVATSKKLVTTSLGRGTEGYRAPEVLRSRGQYNKRSDSFALGCITYEIVTGQKLFDSDWAVLEYVREGIPLYPTKWPPCQTGTRLLQLGELTSMLLAADPKLRLGAKATAQQLRLIRDGEQESEVSYPPEDDDEGELKTDHNTTASLSNPVVQPSLRKIGVGKKRVLDSKVERPSKKGPLVSLGNNGKNEHSSESQSCSFCFVLGLKVLPQMYQPYTDASVSTKTLSLSVEAVRPWEQLADQKLGCLRSNVRLIPPRI